MSITLAGSSPARPLSDGLIPATSAFWVPGRIEIHACISAWTRSSGLPMAVSMGVSHAPHDGNDLITLLAVADISLYQNKAVQQHVSCVLNPNY